jgi:hypothetical protein
MERHGAQSRRLYALASSNSHEMNFLGIPLDLKLRQLYHRHAGSTMKMQNPLRCRWCVILFAWLYLAGQTLSSSQTPFLNVTNFGARGDAATLLANTVSNSTTIICPGNRFTSVDVGKVVELFGAGATTSPTNHQDLVASIVSVNNGTAVTLNRSCGITANRVIGVYGINNASAFQACIDDCSGTNTVVNIPAGQYLLVSPEALNSTYVMPNMFDTHPAVTIQKGGITFTGAGPGNSILLGCGAWQLKGTFAYRGYMFACQGPVTNDASLVFDQLTIDGGASPGRSSYAYFPASTINGNGWDRYPWRLKSERKWQSYCSRNKCILIRLLRQDQK